MSKFEIEPGAHEYEATKLLELAEAAADVGDYKLEASLLAAAGVQATLAVAGYLSQFEICGHGIRGYCPPCVSHGHLL